MAGVQPLGARARAILDSIGIGRLLIALVLAVIGGYLSFGIAMAGVARSKAPLAALRYIPWEARALTEMADGLLASSPQDPPRQIGDLARASLRAQALNPEALRLLGIMAGRNDNQVNKAEQLVSLAARLSRRESGTQVWLVERAAIDGDLPRAIDHIDILLRTRPSMEDTLFPILLRGMNDPDFRTILVTYFTDPQPWVSRFITYAIANAEDLMPLVRLIDEAERFPNGEDAGPQARLLMERLSRAGEYSALRRVYLLLPDAEALRLESATISAEDVDSEFGIAGWLPVDGADAGAAVLKAEGASEPAMLLYADPATTRTVASKLLYLDPGRYSLSTALEDLVADAGGHVSWQLRCPTREAGARTWIEPIPSGRSSKSFTVGRDCPVQFLDVVASGGQGQSGLDATISSVKLRQASANRNDDSAASARNGRRPASKT